jgi:hypothetical protein
MENGDWLILQIILNGCIVGKIAGNDTVHPTQTDYTER